MGIRPDYRFLYKGLNAGRLYNHVSIVEEKLDELLARGYSQEKATNAVRTMIYNRLRKVPPDHIDEDDKEFYLGFRFDVILKSWGGSIDEDEVSPNLSRLVLWWRSLVYSLRSRKRHFVIIGMILLLAVGVPFVLRLPKRSSHIILAGDLTQHLASLQVLPDGSFLGLVKRYEPGADGRRMRVDSEVTWDAQGNYKSTQIIESSWWDSENNVLEGGIICEAMIQTDDYRLYSKCKPDTMSRWIEGCGKVIETSFARWTIAEEFYLSGLDGMHILNECSIEMAVIPKPKIYEAFPDFKGVWVAKRKGETCYVNEIEPKLYDLATGGALLLSLDGYQPYTQRMEQIISGAQDYQEEQHQMYRAIFRSDKISALFNHEGALWLVWRVDGIFYYGRVDDLRRRHVINSEPYQDLSFQYVNGYLYAHERRGPNVFRIEL